MSCYSQIMKGMNMFIHFALKGLSIFRTYVLDRLMTFECVYAWQCLNISIQEALTLILQVRKSHKISCVLKSFTAQHPIPFICQPSWLHTLLISQLHLTPNLSRVCMIMHCGPAVKLLMANFYLSQSVM